MPRVTERLINRPVWFDLSTSDLAAAKAPKMPGQEAAPVTWTVYFGVSDAGGAVVGL